MKMDFEEIKKWPLTTNKIKVAVDEKRLFSEYSIVSYYSEDKEYKNLAYEQLSDLSFLSVCGIRSRWAKQIKPFVKFFVLVKKDMAQEALNCIRSYEKINSKIDVLEEYDDALKKRVFASLAINSLGELKADRMMYNNGGLLICDDKNFMIPRSRKELVCLKIEVNEYLNLIARTVTFSNPRSIEELKRKRQCVFQENDDIHGQWWSGLSVKPVVIKEIKTKELHLDRLYIQKKRFSDSHNIVPYWPYNPENYTHGRLFAISQVVDSVNQKYAGVINLEFSDFEVSLYDEYRADKDMLRFLVDYMKGKRIYIENPFGNKAENVIQQIESGLNETVNNSLEFPTQAKHGDMTIKLCEPKDDSTVQTYYSQSLYRMAYHDTAIQHVVFHDNPKDDEFSKAEARRILIELLVKDCLINRHLPSVLRDLICGWSFIRYKIQGDFVLGAQMMLAEDNKIEIEEFGFSDNRPSIDFEVFSESQLLFSDYDRIRGARDYKVMKKNGNVYLIIDTDEIPILDVGLIDDVYAEILNKTLPLSYFKRKKEAHKYLRGYIGFHLWKEDGLYGEPDASFAYISGVNSENMQIMQSTKMDRMPRVRRIFVLHCENKGAIEKDVNEIVDMLKFGFGRWNEMMTYPFPFKFLKEHLDDISEMAFSKHWEEISYK